VLIFPAVLRPGEIIEVANGYNVGYSDPRGVLKFDAGSARVKGVSEAIKERDCVWI